MPATIPTEPPPLSPVPLLEKRPVEIHLHGQTIVDEYAWLRNGGDPALRAHHAAERAHADAALRHTLPLQEQLRSELRGRVFGIGVRPEAPGVHGRYRFEVETSVDRGDDDGYPVFTRVDTDSGAAEVVLDLNALGDAHPYVSVGRVLPSPDGEFLAYALDRTGDERHELIVVDLRRTSQVLRVGSVGSFEWTDDGAALYLTEVTEGPWRRSMLTRFDVPDATCTPVFHEPDLELSLQLQRATSGDLLFLTSSRMADGRGPIESRWLPADGSTRVWTTLVPRELDIAHRVDHPAGALVYARVDDTSPYGRVVSIPLADPEPASWTELMEAKDGLSLESVSALNRCVAVTGRVEGLPRIIVLDYDSNRTHLLELDEPGCVWSLDVDASAQAPDRVVCSVTSLTRPPTPVVWHLDSEELEIHSPEAVPGFDHTLYELVRTFAPTADGARVPIELIRRRDAQGPQAVMLYGYGCYGYSEEPTFRAYWLSLVDRGVAFAVAHPRGGGEFGQPWHDAGRLLQKRTTWSDFVTAGEHLVNEGLCADDGLVIAGGSAGGTLVAAAANLAPELFRAVVAWVPFADPFFVQLDDTMPFTVFERREWGDPYASQTEMEYLLGHCPFSNVEAKDYPATYVSSAVNDGQVPYWQPTKYVDRLRERRTDDRPLVFRIKPYGGHQGPSRTSEMITELAESMAFVLDQLGITS